jgi:two-component system response regulator
MAIGDLRASLNERGASVTWGALPVLAIDTPLMRRLFVNLIGNALKFRGEHPPAVHVSAREVDNGYEIDVVDNGIGFESEHAERIFAIFKRLHRADRYAGNLPAHRRTSRRHDSGGRAARARRHLHRVLAHGGPNMRRTDPLCVLLVEDNPGDAELMREALVDAGVGARLFHVDDGDAALAFLRASRPGGNPPLPDLVLLDQNLPRVDGRDVLMAMRAAPEGGHRLRGPDETPDLRTVPVVMLSGSQNEDDVCWAYANGANAFLVKPMSLRALVDLMAAVHRFWFSAARLPHRGEPGGF